MNNNSTEPTEPITIWSENVMCWYKFDIKNCIVKLHYDYDDYPDRHWWEKKYVFTYDYYISKPDDGDYTVIATYWDTKGRVLGCSECAWRKLWYVKERIPYPNKGVERPRKDLGELVRLSMVELRPVLPQNVVDAWEKGLSEWLLEKVTPRFV